MTRFRTLGLALALLAALPVAAFAQSSKREKSPSQLAYDKFKQVLDDKKAGQQQVLTAGFDFITQYPSTNETELALIDMADYGTKLNKEAGAWLALLNYHLLDKLSDSNASDEVKVAFQALDAEIVNSQLRLNGTRGDLPGLRSKIDAVAQMKGGVRFLPGLERRYAGLLARLLGAPAAEAHLKTLLQHHDKEVAHTAQQQLNVLAMLTKPLDVKFTAIDGAAVDVSAYRGKLLLVWFWSANGEGSAKEIETVKKAVADHKPNVEIIGVCFDKEEDREKVLKFIKDKKVPGAQYFDGKGKNSPIAKQMNIDRAPNRVLFNKDGILISNNLRAGDLAGEIKKVLAPPQEKKKK